MHGNIEINSEVSTVEKGINQVVRAGWGWLTTLNLSVPYSQEKRFDF